MSTTQQPEALALAQEYRVTMPESVLHLWAADAMDTMRRQHARILELEAQLSVIGAGGVEPLRNPASVAAHDDEREAFEKWVRWACYDIARVSRNAQYESNITEQLWQCWQARAALAATREAAPENIREGAPYDNPVFEQLARDLGVWGTAQSAVCAQFWLAATPAASNSAEFEGIKTATPVVLPDCRGRVMIDGDGECEIAWRGGMPPDNKTNIYTEQQVRTLLAGVSAPAAAQRGE